MKKTLASICYVFVACTFASANQTSVATQGTTAMGWPAGLSNQEAWNLMPPALEGTGQQLPAWARTMVGRMPKTTAAFLQLDYAQRMEGPSDIVWYQLSFGYAHELAVPFEIYLRTAGGEVRRNWDRLFGGSIFWMVTDAVKCPYCMGHCEMNWEVAGLSEDQIAEQSRILAGNDWSTFTPAEQHGLAFARKLTQSPSSITAEDIEQLRTGLGEERAFYVALNSSRYNYMTRISNGFQLTLESDNVFWDYYNMPRPEKK